MVEPVPPRGLLPHLLEPPCSRQVGVGIVVVCRSKENEGVKKNCLHFAAMMSVEKRHRDDGSRSASPASSAELSISVPRPSPSPGWQLADREAPRAAGSAGQPPSHVGRFDVACGGLAASVCNQTRVDDALCLLPPPRHLLLPSWGRERSNRDLEASRARRNRPAARRPRHAGAHARPPPLPALRFAAAARRAMRGTDFFSFCLFRGGGPHDRRRS